MKPAKKITEASVVVAATRCVGNGLTSTVITACSALTNVATTVLATKSVNAILVKVTNKSVTLTLITITFFIGYRGQPCENIRYGRAILPGEEVLGVDFRTSAPSAVGSDRPNYALKVCGHLLLGIVAARGLTGGLALRRIRNRRIQ